MVKQMTDAEHRKAAQSFAKFWGGKGYEKGQSQPFWLSLLGNVFGVEHPEQFIEFEDKVKLTHDSFIDGMIPSTKVLIEQKSLGKDLSKPIRQSDGSLLNPFQQAKRYISELPLSEHPRFVITCNFAEFWVYDMEHPNGEPAIIKLADLPKEYYRLQFIADTGNLHLKKELEVSIKAGELVGKLYDALHDQYFEPNSEHAMKSLNVLCVRLVFCLYAEDAGIFGEHAMFHDYLASFRNKNMRLALVNLFHILDQKPEERGHYVDDDLAAFPYVNGGLFADENIEIPKITDDIIELLLKECSEEFDWSSISPTIFGAVFESTLNPETRRAGGMHYTSIENIHKVIDPLFLDDLRKEFQEIREIKVKKTRNERLRAFQSKLASLKFLDPACGSGNFLTETYLCLRRMENDVISLLNEGNMVLGGVENPIQVSISQFYGIEVNDFAVTVAKTALWIAESQMMKETESIVNLHFDFLPLKTNAFIIEENALRFDWQKLIAPNQLSYIMGNPPFVGKKEQNSEQKDDLKRIFKNTKGSGNLDYVCSWYRLAVDFMKHSPSVHTAFVSTNSITQGEQVPILWGNLLKDDVVIDFAYRTFKWTSESKEKAAVHCVILGFSIGQVNKPKVIYGGAAPQIAQNINPYLVDAPTVIVEKQLKSISNARPIFYGSMPIDSGYLILSQKERDEILQERPQNISFIRPYVGGDELIKGKKRFCLWLKDAEPKKIAKSKLIMKRIQSTRSFRLSSKRPQTVKAANTPYLFGEIRQPNESMLVIPKVSSETRKYIPIAFETPDVIVNGSALIIPGATLYDFGILSSNVHMSWMRTVAGRMKSDYQYSNLNVYNTFPWPNSNPTQKSKILKTAQAILNARSNYPDDSLAELYNELTMPADLRKAHQENDKAVMEAYGFDWHHMSESDCVAALMKMYQKLVNAN